MKALWARYVAKLQALSERERVMVMAAAILAAMAIVYFAAVEPAQRRQRTLLTQITSQKEEIAALEKAAPAQTGDPDAANRLRVDALKEQIQKADEALSAMQRELVPAERMTGVLQDMVARDAQLTLVSLKTLPAEPLVSTAPEAGKPVEPQKTPAEKAHVYKHGVEIMVQGNYTSLHDYLARLERSPWRMYWWRARLNADDDARLTLSVTVYTLSLDRAWLKV